MKISDILISVLLKNKSLALPRLGTFRLNDTAYVLPDDGKQPGIPPGAVTFELDKSTPEDPELIAEISRITGKIKPLASSDLEALVLQATQLLNISKPFQLEGLGSLQKNHLGEVEFVPHIEDDQRGTGEKRLEEPGEPIRFGENYLRPEVKTSSGSRYLTLAALFIIGLSLIGWVGYYFYQRSASEDASQSGVETATVAVADTTTTTTTTTTATVPPVPEVKADSIPVQPQPKADSIVAAPPVQQAASGDGFNIIVEYAKKNRALKRYADLREWGHKAQMTTTDSNTFKIFIPVKAPLSDSAKHRDSLSRFFGRKVWVEKN